MNSEPPYFKRRVSRTLYYYNPNFGDERVCADPECEHPYRRHFDPYEDWAAVGCKYCGCAKFKVSRKLACDPG